MPLIHNLLAYCLYTILSYSVSNGYPYDGTTLPCMDPECIKHGDCESENNCKYPHALGVCENSHECQHGGVCKQSKYGASFCRCTDEFLGSDCSVPQDFVVDLSCDPLDIYNCAPHERFFFSWALTTEHFYAQYKVRETGWMGIQFAETSRSMEHAYPVLGSVLENGTVMLADLWTNGTPYDDDSYDLEDISGWIDGDFTYIRYRTKRDTHDSKDFVFATTDDVVRVAYAYGYPTIDEYITMHDDARMRHIKFDRGLLTRNYGSETIAVGSPDHEVAGYDCCETLDADGVVKLYWSLRETRSGEDEISMAVSVFISQAWVGIGFSPSNGDDNYMKNADAVISLAGEEKPRQYRLSTGPEDATEDVSNDIYDESTERTNGHIIIRFSRLLNTGDRGTPVTETSDSDYERRKRLDTGGDAVILLSELMPVIWAYQPEDPTELHFHNHFRGAKMVDFNACDASDQLSSPATSPPPGNGVGELIFP